jgi:hypothetical protein
VGKPCIEQQLKITAGSWKRQKSRVGAKSARVFFLTAAHIAKQIIGEIMVMCHAYWAEDSANGLRASAFGKD